MNPLRFLDRLFFAPVHALGFGLMRSAWGLVTFVSVLTVLPQRHLFFGANGLFTEEVARSMWRGDYRWSLLDYASTPLLVDLFFTALLACCLLMILGVLPRFATVLSVLLLWSLHEHNPFVFAGGDTLLRLVGFTLMVAPRIDAFSLPRLGLWMTSFARSRPIPAAIMVPGYAYRLLLWQLIVLYGMSLWEKLLGSMWIAGTAVETVIHHPGFARAPIGILNLFTPVTPLVTWATLAFHALWVFLLIPQEVTALLPAWVPRVRLKRIAIACGLLFHGAILLLLDAGNFSLVVFTAYVGLLIGDDFAAMRAAYNWKWKGHVQVFYDGKCRFCLRTMGLLSAADWAKRLSPVDLHGDEGKKALKAAHIATDDAVKALHIRTPKGRVLSGYAAFRELCEYLPPLLILLPVLWLPGAATIGGNIYAWIAGHRKRCMHENCKL